MFSLSNLNKMAHLKAKAGFRNYLGDFNLVARIKSTPKGKFLMAFNGTKIWLGSKGKSLSQKIYEIRESGRNAQGRFRLYCSCDFHNHKGYGVPCKHIHKVMLQMPWMRGQNLMFTDDLIIYDPTAIDTAITVWNDFLNEGKNVDPYPKAIKPKVDEHNTSTCDKWYCDLCDDNSTIENSLKKVSKTQRSEEADDPHYWCHQSPCALCDPDNDLRGWSTDAESPSTNTNFYNPENPSHFGRSDGQIYRKHSSFFGDNAPEETWDDDTPLTWFGDKPVQPRPIKKALVEDAERALRQDFERNRDSYINDDDFDAFDGLMRDWGDL